MKAIKLCPHSLTNRTQGNTNTHTHTLFPWSGSSWSTYCGKQTLLAAKLQTNRTKLLVLPTSCVWFGACIPTVKPVLLSVVCHVVCEHYHFFPKLPRTLVFFFGDHVSVCSLHLSNPNVFEVGVGFYMWTYCSSFLLVFLSLSLFCLPSSQRKTLFFSWCSQTTVICWQGNKNRYGSSETSLNHTITVLRPWTRSSFSVCSPTEQFSVPLLGSLWRVQYWSWIFTTEDTQEITKSFTI